MSVSIEQYLIWGIQLPYEFQNEWETKHPDYNDFYDTFEKYMEDDGVDGLFCLCDGMNGEYVILGKIIEKGDYKDGGYIADNKILNLDNLPINKNSILNKIDKVFGVTGEGSLLLITHYT